MGAYSPPSPGYNTSSYTQATIAAATPTAWTTGNNPITLWTVTGTIRVLACYGKVGATAFTSTAGTGTLSVGIAALATQFLGTTTVNGTTNFIANATWIDTSPTLISEILSTAVHTVHNGNITLTILTNSMTAGAVVMYLDWIPVSAGATVVSGNP